MPDGFPLLYFCYGIFSVMIQCSFKLKRKNLNCILERNIFFKIIWSRMEPDGKLCHLLLSMLHKRAEGKRGLRTAEVEKGGKVGNKLTRKYFSWQKVLNYWATCSRGRESFWKSYHKKWNINVEIITKNDRFCAEIFLSVFITKFDFSERDLNFSNSVEQA